MHANMFIIWKISTIDLLFKYRFCKHKVLKINPVFIEIGLGSEGNAFDGSPSRHLPYHSGPSPASYLIFSEKFPESFFFLRCKRFNSGSSEE